MKAKKLVFLAFCVALALALTYIESLLPLSMGIPGAKLGLANIVTVFVLYACGASLAALTGALRIILSGFMFGNLFSIAYSLGGFILSFLVMVLLKKTNLFSRISISVAGGVAHNMGQLLVAACILSGYVFAYFPWLIVSGIISGLIIGIVSSLILARLEKIIR